MQSKLLQVSVTLVILVLSGTLSMAQTEDTLPPPFQVLQNFFDLSDEQLNAFLALRQTFEEQVTSIHPELQKLQEELHRELESEQPSSDVVGELLIQIHFLQTQIRDARASLQRSFEELLNEKQLEKWQLLRTAASLAPLLPVFKELGLLPTPS